MLHAFRGFDCLYIDTVNTLHLGYVGADASLDGELADLLPVNSEAADADAEIFFSAPNPML